MADEVMLAWALPVSRIQLGPRLMAYVETKAATHTLQLCAQKSNSPTLGKLPPEIVEMIASKVRDDRFRIRIEAWITGQRCFEDSCSPSHHYTAAELRDMITWASPVNRKGLGYILDGDGESDARHKDYVTSHGDSITGAYMTKCKEVRAWY